MRLVFAGTPDFAVPSLCAAVAHGEVVAVYTQPDRPAGRGRGLAASPVKLAALELGLPVLQPQTLRTAEARAALRALRPDLMVVVAYGLLATCVQHEVDHLDGKLFIDYLSALKRDRAIKKLEKLRKQAGEG